MRKFLTLSNGELVGGLEDHLAAHEEKRKKAQRRFSHWHAPKNRQKWRGKGYEKARETLTQASAEIAKRRRHHHEQVIDELLAMPFDVFVIEDTTVANLTRSSKGTVDLPGKNVAAKTTLNRRILTQGISQFRTRLIQRCRKAGKVVLLVHAAYTSQRCSACGNRTDVGSSEIYTCKTCGHRDDRDINAAKNIRDAGMDFIKVHGLPPVGGEWGARALPSG